MKKLFTAIITLLTFPSYGQWTHVYTSSTVALKSIFFKDALNGYSCGVDTAAHKSIILHSTDGGDSWIELHQANGYDAYSIVAIGDTISCFATDSLMQPHKIVSYDNGTNWQTVADAAYRYGVSVHNHAIYHVANGQLIKDSSNVATPLLDSVVIFSVNTAGITTFSWELSMPMRVKHSIDFGTSWTNIASFEPYLLFSGNQSAQSCIAKFADTIIIKYTYPPGVNITYDNGLNWQKHVEGDSNPLFPSTATKIVSGKTLFSSFEVGTWPNLYFKITKSENSGTSWFTQDSIAGEITQFFFFNLNKGFACTEKGEILKTTNGGGTTSISQPSLKGKLKVYPNPTSGVINISLGAGIESAEVAVIDVLGRQVAKQTVTPANNTISLANCSAGTYVIRTMLPDQSVFTSNIVVYEK